MVLSRERAYNLMKVKGFQKPVQVDLRSDEKGLGKTSQKMGFSCTGQLVFSRSAMLKEPQTLNHSGFPNPSVLGKISWDLGEPVGFRPLLQGPFPAAPRSTLIEFWERLTIPIKRTQGDY
jgi:hypothetical protein